MRRLSLPPLASPPEIFPDLLPGVLPLVLPPLLLPAPALEL